MSLGIVLMPIVLVFLLTTLQTMLRSQSGDYQDMIQRRRLVRTELSRAVHRGNEHRVSAILPEGMEMIISTEDGEVIYSNLSEITPGDALSFQQISGAMLGDVRGRGFSVDTFPSQHGGRYLVFSRYLPPPPPPGRFLLHWRFVGLVVLGGLFLFTLIFSLYFLRGLHSSIQGLQRAAERISAGDLDTEVAVVRSDEIGVLAKDFDSMRIALKEERKRKDRFLMAVSHDLKTPLALIQGYTEALKDGFGEAPEKREKYLDIVLEKTALLESRVQDLLDFVRVDSGEWKLKREETELWQYLPAIIKELEQDVFLSGKRLVLYELPQEPVTVYLDPRLTRRVLENIIINALTYGTGREIHISASVEKQRTFLRISNSIDENTQVDTEAVFEPFFRGSRSRSEQGTGLGLTAVKSIVELHGWQVRAFAVNGKMTIEIQIPRL